MATALEQLSCENPLENALSAAFLAPFRAIFGISKHDTLFLYAWVFLLMIYIGLYFLVPICFLNSDNGFISGKRTTMSALLLFVLFVWTYAVWNRDAACASKRKKALYYLVGQKPDMPAYLNGAVNRIALKSARKENNWSPQSPVN